MPLLKRKPIPPIPLPPGVQDGTIAPEAEVFLLKATGEIFLEYEAYAKRMSFYLQKIFTCEYTGKTGLDYFECLDSEYDESKKTQAKFPEALKPRILRACQFQVEGRLESLVDTAFDRFNNRYFVNEKVIVSAGGSLAPGSKPGSEQVYFGIIVRVEPPNHIREMLPRHFPNEMRFKLSTHEHHSTLHCELVRDPATGAETEVFTPVPGEGSLALDVISHHHAGRLECPKREVDAADPPSWYEYHVRLMEDGQFKGDVVLVPPEALARDRQAWSKNLLKKYLKECLTRDPAVGAPWMVKERLSALYHISTDLPEAMRLKSDMARDELLTKRRGGKPKRELSESDYPVTKRTRGPTSDGSPLVHVNGAPHSPSYQSIQQKLLGGEDAHGSSTPGGAPPLIPTIQAPAPLARPRAVKYPTEDLELDPTTIFDGRWRNRKVLDLPPLPKRPLPQKELPVPHELFDSFISCWNFLNIFGQAVQISPFTLDDFASALYHTELEPRCILLGEIHAVLSSAIASEGGRMQAGADHIPYLAATAADEDGMTVEEREMWVSAALDYCRGWDRRARPKAAEGRQGWEHHLLGVLTQRGGLEAMPGLPTILKHLFTDDDEGDEASGKEKPKKRQKPARVLPDEEADTQQQEQKEQADDVGTAKKETVENVKMDLSEEDEDSKEGKAGKGDEEEDTKDELMRADKEERPETPLTPLTGDSSTSPTKSVPKSRPRFAGSEDPDPEYRYLSLTLAQKLEILSFLCEYTMMGKAVRNYIDDCELRLTEERKEKADINKEKKELLAERALLLNPNAAPGAAGMDGLKPDGEPASNAGTPQPLATPSMEIDETTSLSIAPSERDESVMPDEGLASRQVSSSPLPDLGDDEDEDGEDEDELERDDSPKKKGVASSVAPERSEVGSDVDELASSEEEEEVKKPPPRAAKRGAASKGRNAKRGKKLIKEPTPTPTPTPSPEPEPVDRKTAIEEELEMNAKKDDLYERDWRRHREVARIRPLGKDRFHQRYWWFDGIGPQSLVAPNGRVIYGTGRLFVQGPSQVDWDRACMEFGGANVLDERRRKEQGHDTLLGIDEWAYYEEEEDILQILAWLNTKGHRELAFKNNLQKWKHYIIEGAKSRQSDLLHGLEAAARRTRGPRRSQDGQSNAQHYLAYENSLAQK